VNGELRWHRQQPRSHWGIVQFEDRAAARARRMENFRDRFGLAWKDKLAATEQSRGGASRDTGSAESQRTVPALDDALIFYTRPFLEVLKGAGSRARLLEIAEKINARMDIVIPVARYLVDRSYITTLDQNRAGNDLVELTPAGENRLNLLA
jgi:hypothetical protein